MCRGLFPPLWLFCCASKDAILKMINVCIVNVHFTRHLQNLVDIRQLSPLIIGYYYYYYYYSEKGQKRISTKFLFYNIFWCMALIWFVLESYHPQCFARSSISCFSRPEDNSFYLRRVGKEADQFPNLGGRFLHVFGRHSPPPLSLLPLSVTAAAKKFMWNNCLKFLMRDLIYLYDLATVSATN